MENDRRKFIKMAGYGALAAPLVGAVGGLGASAAQAATTSASGVGKRRNVMGGFGDFKYRTVVGAFERNHEYMWPEVTFQDMPLSAAWIWGSLYADDGRVFVFTRDMPPRVANGLLLYDNRDGKACHVAPECMKAYRGALKVDRTSNGIIWRSMDYGFTGSSSLEVEVSGDKFRWFEKDLLDITGTMVPHAVQIYSPGPKGRDGFSYVSQYIRVKGTVLGKKVDGWLGYDFIYFAAGITYPTSMLGSRGKVPGINCAWPSFANEYEDGSWECGYLGAGLEDWQFAIGVDNKGNVMRGHVVNMDIKEKPNRFPLHLDFRVYDEVKGIEEDWVWDTVPNTDLLDIPKLFPDIPVYWASEGFLRRKNETRKIKRSLGWPDFYQDERLKIYREDRKKV